MYIIQFALFLFQCKFACEGFPLDLNFMQQRTFPLNKTSTERVSIPKQISRKIQKHNILCEAIFKTLQLNLS